MGIEGRTRFTDGDTALSCSIVPWDSEAFGFVVAQIDEFQVGGSGVGEIVTARFAEWCSARGVRLASCRLDHRHLRESMELERIGFRFIEMVYRPRLELSRFSWIVDPNWKIASATLDDVDALAEVAGTVFTTGRFILDGRLNPDLNGHRYETWVRRGFLAPAHSLLKVLFEGRVVAFFLVETRAEEVYWHLTALAPEWQGQGLGVPAWASVLAHHRDRGSRAVETTISGHNLAAMNIYARLGFSFNDAQMTFHWLRDQAAPAIGNGTSGAFG